MAFNKKYFEIAAERLSRRRIENKQIEDIRRAEIHGRIPKYSELECRLADTMTRIIAAISEKASDSEEAVKQAIKNNLAIQQEMGELLIQNGYSADYLNPIFTCPKCKDTGTVDGNWCDCFNKILNGIAAEELNSHSPLRLSSFESFDLELYPDRIDPVSGEKQREIMRDNFNECLSFAQNFNGRGYGLFMLGSTGLGKTHLSLAIANKLIQKGFCVVYGSTPELLRKLDKEQFGKSDGDTMGLITDCDLLILDDLGAESKNDRYISLLYEIINARQSRSLPIIVNTNLNMDEIKNRYQDRLWSRLFSMRVLLFCGDDNRLKTAIN